MSKGQLDAAEKLIKPGSFEVDYDVEHELGRGRFAIVKRCVHKTTGKRYAVKIVKKSKNTHGRSGREQLLMEISILNKSSHPKMVRLYDVFETRAEMQLILEYAEGGDLHRHCIETDIARTEKEICYLIRQILEAIRYLHSEKVVHLDLKPDNILLAKKAEVFPEIRLIDFGLSRSLEGPYSQFDIVGTAEYVSPEVLAFDPIDYGSDMWSIGVVTYVLLSGISPFAGDDVMETYANIGLVDYDFDCEEFDDISDAAIDFIEKLLLRNPKKRMSSREALEHEWIKQLDGGVSTQDVILAQRAKRELLSDDVESLPLENQEMISSSGSEASFEKLSDVSEGNTRRSIDNISEKNKDGLREDLSNDQFSEDKAEMADQGTGLLMTETYIENLENERCSNEDSSFKESKKEESTFIRNDERSYAEICKKDEKNNIYDHCKSEVIKRDDEAVDISLVEEEKDKQLENKRGNKKVDGFLDIPAKGEKFNLDVCTERNGENTVSDKDLSNVYDLREGHSTQSTETKTAFGIEKAEISQKEISFTKSNLEESLMDAFWGECEKSHDIKKSVSPKDAGFSVKNKVPNSDNTCYEIEKKKNCHPEFGNDHTTQAKYEQIDKSTYIDSIVGKKNVNFGRVYKKKIPVPIPIRKTEEIPKLLTQSKVKTGTIATKMAKFDQPTEGDLAAKLSSVSKYSSKFERKDTAKNYELASTDLGMKKTKQHMMGFAEIKNDLEKESVRMSRIKSDSVLSDASVLNPTQEVTSTSLKRQSNTGQMLPCSENDLVQPTTFSHCVNDSVIHKDELLGHTSGSNETICEKETPVTNNQSHAISLDKAIHSNKGCLSDGKEKLTPTKAKHKPLIKNPPDIPLKPNKSRIIEDRNKVDANYLSRSEDLKSKIEVDPVKESYDLHKTARTGSGLKFSLNIGGACSSGKKLNIGPLISVGSKNATKEFRHELNNSEPACVKIVDSEENTRESKSESINDARNRSESFLRRRNEEGSNRKTYRRLYVTKVRNSKVYEHDFDISNEAAKIIQRVDKDVLQVEVKLKSTDLKLLP